MARNLVEILVKLLKVGTGAQEAEKELTGLDKAVKVAGAAMATFAVKETAAAVFELGKLGAESLRTRTSFEAISGSAGEAATRLDAMKRATRGAISEQAAMASANKLMQMGLADSADSLEKTATLATRLGSAMGKDATQALEEWTLLMANQSIPRLDTFGVSASKVRARMVELKASVADMTREQAFTIAATEEAEASLARLGEAADDDMLAFERLEASSADLKAMLGELLAPAVADVAEEAAGFTGKLVEQQRAIEAYRRALGDAAVEAAFAEDGYHRQGRAVEGMIQWHSEHIRMMEQAGEATDGWMVHLNNTTGAADAATEAEGRLAGASRDVAKAFGELTIDDQTIWKMALASGASVEVLADLAQTLGIASEGEIELTLRAFEARDELGEGTITADEYAGKMGALREASVRASEQGLGAVSAEAQIVYDTLGDAVVQTDAFTEALNRIPTHIKIKIETEVSARGGMPTSMPEYQRGGVWSGGVGWVGEGGPELAIFPRGTRIVPAWQSRQVRQSNDNRQWRGGDTTIIIHDPLAMAMVLEEKRRETGRRLRRGM